DGLISARRSNSPGGSNSVAKGASSRTNDTVLCGASALPHTDRPSPSAWRVDTRISVYSPGRHRNTVGFAPTLGLPNLSPDGHSECDSGTGRGGRRIISAAEQCRRSVRSTDRTLLRATRL